MTMTRSLIIFASASLTAKRKETLSMQLSEFFKKYNFHDSVLEAIAYLPERKQLILEIDFCYWMQDDWTNCGEETGILYLTLKNVSSFECIPTMIYGASILSADCPSDDSVEISLFGEIGPYQTHHLLSVTAESMEVLNLGKRPENTVFYDGYEPEPAIILAVPDKTLPLLCIWDGYFYDIFGNPPLHGLGWTGFTRDLNQCERAFSGENDDDLVPIQEYYEDLLDCGKRTFRFHKTGQVYDLLCSWFRQAMKNGHKEIRIHVV